MKKDKKVSERADVPPKRGEAEEEGTDKLLQTLLDHTHMLVAYLDPKFNFVRVNRAYAKADERDPSFFSGKNHFDLYPDAENEGIFKEVVKTGKPYFAYAKPFEYAEHPERGVSYWDWSLIPTKVPSGAVAGLVLTLVNVTERKLAEEALRKARDELEIRVEERTRELSAANIELKEEVAERQRAEEKLRASEEKYKTLVETSRDMIFTVDLKGNFLFTNQAFGKILGYSAEEIGSLNGFDLVHPEDSKTVAQQFARLVEGESVDNMEYRYRRKEGSYITILNSAAPVFDTDENVAAAFGVARDITQRKQAEKALQESELWMRNMFNSLEEAVLVVTPDRALVNINQAAQKMFGYEKDELVDLSTEVLHVDHEHYVEFGRRIQEAFDREEPASFEFEVKRKNGEIFPSQHTVTLLKNDIGESLGIVSVVRDVTERRRAERELNQYREHLEELVEERTAELKRANERLAREVTERKRAQEALRAEKEFTERALNAQTDTFFVFEPSTRRAVRWNKTFNKTSGYSDEEIRSMKAPDSYYGEEDLKKAAAAAEKILREGVATVELSLITKDGRSIPTEYTGSAITDDEGNPKYIIAVGRDVTDRKRAEQELHKRTYDLNERVKELNCLYLISNLVEKPGISLEEILQGTADLIPAAWEYPEIACARVILGGKIFRTDNFEETLWKQVTDITVHGNPVGSVGVCYLEERPEKDEGPFLADERNLLKAIAERLGRVVERTQAREEIQKLNESLKAQAKELAAANKELEAFSYSASHDLRAPLRTIDGFSRALLEDYPDKLDETGKDYLQRVRSATERMGQLIDDLLNLSLTMRREMRREEANLSHLASTVAADLQGTIPERQVEFVVQDEVLAHGDARLLRELLENLLGNAWKFTAKNSHPRIEFGITEKEGEEVYFVRDNGVGFDMTYADKLFVPFQRLHSDSEFSGNGIGLALVSRIINRHGGRIWAEGEVDKGASFYFTLQ